MYAWIWRKLPFGLPGKLVGSLVLCLGAAALLWFVAFPQLSSLVTPKQSTIDNDNDNGGGEEEQSDDGSDDVTDNPTDYDLEESPTDENGETRD